MMKYDNKAKIAFAAAFCFVGFSDVAFAACKVPNGKYSGQVAGEVFSYSTGGLAGYVNSGFSVVYTPNGSGTVVETDTREGTLTSYSVAPRGTQGHTWNATTCSGFIGWTILGGDTLWFQYSVVNSGNEIQLNDANGLDAALPFTIVLKKLEPTTASGAIFNNDDRVV